MPARTSEDLPAAGRPDHDQHAALCQDVEAGCHLHVPPEEGVRIAHVVRRQAQVGAGQAGVLRRRVHEQRRLLPEDGPFQGDQLGTRIESELVGEDRAYLPQRLQRLRLLTRPVERERQQCPSAFPGRRLVHTLARLGQDLPVTSGAQRGLQPQLLRLQAQLVEAQGLDLSRVPIGQVRERRPAPQLQGLSEEERRPLGFVDGEHLAGPGDEPLEHGSVDVLGGDGQPVAVRHRVDGLRPERLPKPDDTALHDLRPGRRRPLRPQRVGEAIRAAGLAASGRERGQHDAVARRETDVDAVDGKRTEHGYPHAINVRPRRSGRQRKPAALRSRTWTRRRPRPGRRTGPGAVRRRVRGRRCRRCGRRPSARVRRRRRCRSRTPRRRSTRR